MSIEKEMTTPEKKNGAGARRPFSTEQAGQGSPMQDSQADSIVHASFLNEGSSTFNEGLNLT